MSTVFAFGSPVSSTAGTHTAHQASTATTPAFGFGNARPFGSAATASAPSARAASPGPFTLASLDQEPESQVASPIVSHDAQRLASFSAATHTTTFNTTSSLLTFSVLLRTSETKAKSLDALIVIHSALGKPILARFAVSLQVEQAAGPGTGFGAVPSPTFTISKSAYSPATMTRIASATVVETACDCSNIVRPDSALIKIASVTVSIQHQPVVEPPPVVAGIVLDTNHLALLATLDDPQLSDCALLPKDSTDPIHVSRAILAQSSPFFKSMFCGSWAESVQADKPIEFGWSTHALVICLIHVYSGGQWLPEQVPKSKAVKGMLHKRELGALIEGMTRHLWNEVIDLAVMLELFALAKVANRKLGKLLDVESGELEKKAKEVESLRRGLLVEE